MSNVNNTFQRMSNLFLPSQENAKDCGGACEISISVALFFISLVTSLALRWWEKTNVPLLWPEHLRSMIVCETVYFCSSGEPDFLMDYRQWIYSIRDSTENLVLPSQTCFLCSSRELHERLAAIKLRVRVPPAGDGLTLHGIWDCSTFAFAELVLSDRHRHWLFLLFSYKASAG